MITRTKYFSLPSPATDDESQIAAAVFAQLSQYESSLTADDAPEKKSEIAADLVRFSRAQPLSLALNILIEASQHPLFLDSSAHQVITDGINKEKSIYHSPLITGELTLNFVLEYRRTHQQEVDNFLVNPELLLMWINFATPLEVSNLFDHFYHPDTKFYVQLRNMAKEESESGNPGKALLCSTLMSHGTPTDYGVANIRRAATAIYKNERVEPYQRTFTSLQFRVFPTIENINIANAAGCFINANKVKFSAEEFTYPSMQGVNFINADLDYSTFMKVDLTGAIFNDASLVGVNFSESKLCNAKLCATNLSHCSLQNADLSHADLSGANLSFANLQGANLATTKFDDTTLDDAELITTSNINNLLLAAELTRLHNMIKGHAQEAKLRKAICQHLINYTRTPEVNDRTAANLLKIAKDHEIFGKHDELHYLKAGINYAVSAYQTLYSTYASLFSPPAPAPVPAATDEASGRYETKEQKHLREEYEKRESNAVKRASNRPAEPDHPPPPTPR